MGFPADYNVASFATRCNFRPPNWVPEPVSMLPIPRDRVAAQECVGDNIKGPKPTLVRPAAKVLDIAYPTIHVDAGALAFTRRKNLPPRHLPPRHFGKTSQNTHTTWSGDQLIIC